MTPGTYLRLRREAAGLSIADVATAVADWPELAAHVPAHVVEQIEADALAPSFPAIVALRHAFACSLDILEELATIQLGVNAYPPRLCRTCGWSDDEPTVDDDRTFPERERCSRCVAEARA